MARRTSNPYHHLSKFTLERRQSILDAISNRIPYQLAAEANGISEETLHDWLRVGRRDLAKGEETEFSQFSENIKKIELEKMKEHLNSINTSPERWQAQAWILERRWWKYFSSSAAIIDFNKRLEQMENDNQGAIKDVETNHDEEE
jgi:transposase-like protein